MNLHPKGMSDHGLDTLTTVPKSAALGELKKCSMVCLEPRFPRGYRSGSGGTRGENFCDNGKRTEFAGCSLPFETELQLSDGNIILCIKIAQIPLYFALQGCISF